MPMPHFVEGNIRFKSTGKIRMLDVSQVLPLTNLVVMLNHRRHIKTFRTLKSVILLLFMVIILDTD